MKTEKNKRPRKPAQPIKVAGNTKTRLSGESGSHKPVDASKDKYLTNGVRGLMEFYRDEVGKWR